MSTSMLHVRKMDGSEVAVPKEQVWDVRSLKQFLQRNHDQPSRFQQRITNGGVVLSDETPVHEFRTLQLVVLTCEEPSSATAKDWIRAIRDSDVSKSEEMLQHPFCLVALDNALVGQTSLLMAVDKGIPEMVALLLEAGVDRVDKETPSTRITPLKLAAMRGHTEVVRLLLEAGAGKDIQDLFFDTPLSVAAASGHMEVVSLLLQAKANKDAGSPVVKAVSGGNAMVVSLLLEAKADKDKAAENIFPGKTMGARPLGLAASAGSMEIVHVLLAAKADKDMADEAGNTPLIRAAVCGHVEVARLLLEAKAAKDVADQEGMTPLMWAADAGNAELVSLLLEASANSGTGMVDNEGRTALHIASAEADADVVRLLLDSGVDKDKTSIFGQTALHVAAIHGRCRHVQLLLTYGVDMQRADKLGRTPLVWAIRSSQFDVADLLLLARAQLKLHDSRTRMLFEGARKKIPQRTDELIFQQVHYVTQ